MKVRVISEPSRAVNGHGGSRDNQLVDYVQFSGIEEVKTNSGHFHSLLPSVDAMKVVEIDTRSLDLYLAKGGNNVRSSLIPVFRQASPEGRCWSRAAYPQLLRHDHRHGPMRILTANYLLLFSAFDSTVYNHSTQSSVKTHGGR